MLTAYDAHGPLLYGLYFRPQNRTITFRINETMTDPLANANDYAESQNFPPIYTSEDEHEMTPRQPIQRKGTLSNLFIGVNLDLIPIDPDPLEVDMLQTISEAADIAAKKPKMSAAASLVSYALDEDEDDEDQSALTEEEEENSSHFADFIKPLDKPDLVHYSVNAENDTSSSHLELEDRDIADTENQSTLLMGSTHQTIQQPIHVPSQEQLRMPQISDTQPKDPSPTSQPVFEPSYDRSKIKQLLEEVELPPEPSGHCPMKLQERVDREVHRMRLEIDYDPNRAIQDNKAFRNPSIYEKLIAFLNIDEKGTNFPPEVYNPYRWAPQSYYDELARVQNREIDRLVKLQKEQKKADQTSNDTGIKVGGGALSGGLTKTASQPVLNTSSGGSVATGYTEPKKRSKWDTGIPETSSLPMEEAPMKNNTATVPHAVDALAKQS
ncbi:HCNGP-like protein, partial [Opisthorchis viverrini]